MDRTRPHLHRWSLPEYYQLVDLGLFQGRRVELIDGKIIDMPAMKNEHAVALGLAEEALRGLFGAGCWVRSQLPLHVGPRSAPEPDLAVVEGQPRDFAEHPTSARLVVEISDTTLAFDRGRKAALYAYAGIPEYWIVNLVERRLEVQRSPRPHARRPRRSEYAVLTFHDAAEEVAPLARPDRTLTVAELLP